MQKKIKSFIQGSLVVVVSILVTSTIIKAGTITPPSETPVTAKFYTLSEIHTRLITNATATEGGHDFTFSDSLASTHHTLTEIYDAIPTIIANTVKLDTTYLGVKGTLVPDGTAIATDCLDTKTFYSGDSWTQKTGSIADCSSEGSQSCYATGTYFAGTQQSIDDTATSQSVGYYPAFDLATVDTDLVASNIGANVSIFGVSGTLLKDEYNGSASSGDYPIEVGGVDDYNNGGSMPSDSYAGSWTTCDAGNSYCQTGDVTNADKKDNSTGLVWSTSIGTSNWFTANNCAYPNGLGDGACDANGEVACKCVKLTGPEGNGAKTGCEALGGAWRLPHQKELMQAYIDGSWGNLSLAGSRYWSAATISNNTHLAWYTNLSSGHTTYGTKTTTTISVRCVR